MAARVEKRKTEPKWGEGKEWGAIGGILSDKQWHSPGKFKSNFMTSLFRFPFIIANDPNSRHAVFFITIALLNLHPGFLHSGGSFSF